MAEVELRKILQPSEVENLPEEVRRKLFEYLRGLQAQQGSLEPVEILRRKYLQVDRYVGTLRQKVEHSENLINELQSQLVSANNEKLTSQTEISGLKEQLNDNSTTSADWQGQLQRYQRDKTDLSAYVLRCRDDEERNQATISELQNEKQQLINAKREKQIQCNRLKRDLNNANKEIERINSINNQLQTSSDDYAAHINALTQQVQGLHAAHVQETNDLRRQVEISKQEAQVANRDQSELEEKMQALQEQLKATFQNQASISKTAAETFDEFTRNIDTLQEQLATSTAIIAEKERDTSMLKSAVDRLANSVSDNETKCSEYSAQIAELKAVYTHNVENLSMQLAESRALAELLAAPPPSSTSHNNRNSTAYTIIGDDDDAHHLHDNQSEMFVNHKQLLRKYAEKCADLHTARQQIAALNQQVEALLSNQTDSPNISHADRQQLIKILENKTALTRIVDELSTRGEELDTTNGQLYAQLSKTSSDLIERNDRLSECDFRMRCLSQQVRYLLVCVEKLHGREVSFDNADDTTDDIDVGGNSLTESQRSDVSLLQPVKNNDSLDMIRKHFVNFSNVQELQLINLKLTEAIYQLEAYNVLRGGGSSSSAELKQELGKLQNVCQMQAARFAEVSTQCDVVVRQREAYRRLCDPALLAVVQPLLQNDSSLASLLHILSSNTLGDVSEQLQTLKQAAAHAQDECKAFDDMLHASKEHVTKLQEQLRAERDQHKQQIDAVRLEYNYQQNAVQQHLTKIATLETTLGAQTASIRAATNRAKELEGLLGTHRNKITALQAELTSARSEIQSAEIGVGVLEQNLRRSREELEISQQREAEALNRVAALQQQLSNAATANEHLQSARHQYEAAAEEHRRLKAHSDSLQARVQDAEKRLGEMEKSNDALKARLTAEERAQQNLLTSHAAELENVRKQSTNVENELDRIRKLYDALLTENNLNVDLHQEHEEMRNAFDYHRELADRYSTQLASVNALYEETKAALATERAEWQRDKSSLEEQFQQAQIGSQTTRTVMLKMQNAVRQRNAVIAQRDATIRQLNETSAMLKEQVDMLTSNLQETEQQLKSQQTQTDSLKSQVIESMTALEEHKYMLDQLKNEMQTLKHNSDGLDAEYQAAKTDWLEREAQLVVQNDKLRRELEEGDDDEDEQDDDDDEADDDDEGEAE